MLSPRQIFEDNIRPADLLLKGLSGCWSTMRRTPRPTCCGRCETLVKADKDEGLMVIYNEIFLGLIPRTGRGRPHGYSHAVPCAICCGKPS